jgi:hypothetical protein
MAYRDKHTGRFVSASTWKRSKAQGRSRYVRVGLSKRSRATRPSIRATTRTRPQATRFGRQMAVGYIGRNGNSYTLIVNIHPKKNLTDSQTTDLISRLAGSGHFDDSPANPIRDLTWATFYNASLVCRRDVRIPPGRATLVDFYRGNPECN